MSYGNTMCDALICILIYMLFASIFSKYGPTKAGEQHFYFFLNLKKFFPKEPE